jgi:DNA-binding NtrC family response regulator
MIPAPGILIVDDQLDFVKGLGRVLRARLDGTPCFEVTSGGQALEVLGDRPIGVMLTDLRMPGLGGIELTEAALKACPHLSVVVLTAYGTVESAVKALKRGAYDFITKPIEGDALLRVVNKAMERHQLVSENARLRKLTVKLDFEDAMVGESLVMQRLKEQVAAVAENDYTVLIRGESGTGKELVAHSIHRLSARRQRPCLSVNCPAIPEQLLESELFGHVRGAFTGAERNHKGLFENAHGGTLLLDEIGDLSHHLQAKLLRVLQEKEIRPVGSGTKRLIDVRILALTNQDLEEKIRSGSFREDLFYRLNVLTITVPPLRDRREDIPLLTQHFIAQTCREMDTGCCEILPEALAHLGRLPWPGNVRELINFVRRLVVFCRRRTIDLPLVRFLESGPTEAHVSQNPVPYKEAKQRAMDDFTRLYAHGVLEISGGNISKAARLSGLERVSLQKIVRRLNIDPERFRRR